MRVTSWDVSRHAAWMKGRSDGKRLVVVGGQLAETVVLAGQNLRMARFRATDFTKARLPLTTLDEAEIDRCRFDEADLDAAELRSARVVETSFDRVHMPIGHFEQAWISGGTARGAGLQRTSWAGAIVCGVDFSGAYFDKADLGGGLFVRCDLRGARLDGARAAGARFDRCEIDDPAALAGADFRRCPGVPESPGEPPRRARELWAAFAKGFTTEADRAELEAGGILDATDEQLGFAVAGVILRELHMLFVFQGLGAEVRRIAAYAPIVRDEETLAEGRRVAAALRALAETTAKLPDSTVEHQILADMARFGALAVEHAPNLDATLAHATRYLGELQDLSPDAIGPQVERVAKAMFRRPPDGRIPHDERRRALAYSEPGTLAGQVAADLAEGSRWTVITFSPTELRLRHHAGVELVARLDGGRIVSREIVHDEPEKPGQG